MWVFTRVGEVADVPGFVGIMGGDAFWLSDNNTTAAAPVKVTLGGNGTVVVRKGVQREEEREMERVSYALFMG